jgi:hypothetical protein
MPVNVDTIRERISAICQDDIVGITETVEGAPRNLATADLPAAVVLTGQAERNARGADTTTTDMVYVTRVFRVALIVKPWIQGVVLEAEELCMPFFERFEQAFGFTYGLTSDTHTTPLDSVQDSWLGNDTGVADVDLGGVRYAGVVFDVWVEYLTLRDCT